MRKLLIALGLALMAVLPAQAQLGPLTSLMLLNNAAATGALFNWPGGPGVFTAVGTFGGATVSLQFVGPDGSTLVSAGTNTTCTAACAGVFYLPAGQIKAVVTGGAPSGLYVSAKVLTQLTG